VAVGVELRQGTPQDELVVVAREQHGVVSAAQAAFAGVSANGLSRRCRSGALVRLAPRVYLVPSLLDDLSHLAAAQLRCPAAVASHRSAALLHALDGVAADTVEVTVPRDVRLRGAGVHRSADLLPFEVVTVEGILCTDPTRTLCDVGSVAPSSDLERAVESALRRRLTSVPRLRWRARELARSGRPGPGRLLAVLDRRGTLPATESDLETRFLQCIRGHLPDPQRQVQVGPRQWADAGWPDANVAVELDSWEWHGDRRAFQRDRTRQNGIVLARWTVLRFTWADVVDRPGYVIATCRAALVAAAVAQR
jgi:hypothetical protein